MKKRIVAIFLCFAVMVHCGVTTASAVFLEALSAVGSVASIVGTGLSALQISGVFGDDTSEQLKKMNKTLTELKGEMQESNKKLDSINSQLSDVCNRLGNIEKKLDGLKKDITDVKKKQIVSDMYHIINSRSISAKSYAEAWRDFAARYKEPMDKTFAKYKSMIISGISNWCENPASRDADIIKNSSIIVAFNEKDGELSQIFTYQNNVASLGADAKYVIIDESLLPKGFIFESSTYRNIITGGIKTALIDAVAQDKEIISKGLEQFAPEDKKLDEDFAQFIANAAYNALVYRIACIEVNARENSSFISEIKVNYDNYISHLLAQSDGIDAFIQTQYMTHTFEYELGNTITDFCDSIQNITAVYGLLVTDVLSLSRATESKDETIDAFFRKFDADLDKIALIGKQSYTGHGNYCYITDSLIHLGKVNYEYSATLMSKPNLYQLDKSSLDVKAAGNEFASSQNRLDSSAALLIYNCTTDGTDYSFENQLKTVGAWDYDDMGDVYSGIIMLERGEQSEFEGASKSVFYKFDLKANTKLEDAFGYSDALGGGTAVDNKCLAGDYLDTLFGEVEADGTMAGFMIVHDKEADQIALFGANAPFEAEHTKSKINKFVALYTEKISAKSSYGYLYQTKLSDADLGELSPLRHMDTLYLSSIYSEGKPLLIITLGCVAFVAAAAAVTIVVVWKKKAKKDGQSGLNGQYTQ